MGTDCILQVKWSIFWLNRGLWVYFICAGYPVLKLVIRQCLGLKGLRVEIVSFVLFKNCIYYQNHFLHVLPFSSIHQKKWSYCTIAELTFLYMVYFLNKSLFWDIMWKLWSAIKTSCSLGKNLNIFFFPI